MAAVALPAMTVVVCLSVTVVARQMAPQEALPTSGAEVAMPLY